MLKVVLVSFMFVSAVRASSVVQASDESLKVCRYMNIKSWKILLNNNIVLADNDCFIKQKKYGDSIRKVISVACVDCLFGCNQFYNKGEHDLITFEGTDPNSYTNANWNCVVLYNYLNKMKYAINTDDDITEFDLFNDVYDLLLDNFKQFKIDNLEEKLQKAINDIVLYTQALNLIEIFCSNLKDVNRWKEICKLCADCFMQEGAFNGKSCDDIIVASEKSPSQYDANDWFEIFEYNFLKRMKQKINSSDKKCNKVPNAASRLLDDVAQALKNKFKIVLNPYPDFVNLVIYCADRFGDTLAEIFKNKNDMISVIDKNDKQITIDNIFYKTYFGIYEFKQLEYPDIGGISFKNKKDKNIYLTINGQNYKTYRFWLYLNSYDVTYDKREKHKINETIYHIDKPREFDAYCKLKDMSIQQEQCFFLFKNVEDNDKLKYRLEEELGEILSD